MKRVDVPEFEDSPRCPGWLRDALTRLIRVLSRTMGFDEAVANVLKPALRSTGCREVLDMGSGAGGIMPEVLAALRSGDDAIPEATITLSDRFPNRAAIETYAGDAVPGMRYRTEPLDATRLEEVPPGMKTMVNSFHHLSPEVARSVLASAHASRTPILIFELADNRLPFWLWVLTLPLGLALVFCIAVLMTPRVRPLTARQLLFTFVVPIIPLLYAWDGQASYPRIYGEGDLEELTRGLDQDYTWTVGTGKTTAGKTAGFYLLGMPGAADLATSA